MHALLYIGPMVPGWLRPLALLCCAAGWACSSATDSSVSGAAASIGASPAVVAADGVQKSTITVVVRAAKGVPLPNTAVVFETSDANAILVQPGTTGADGVGRGSIASTTIGDVTVRAALQGAITPAALLQGITVQFAAPGDLTAGDANAPTYLDFVASPGEIAADGEETTFLSLMASQGGAPVGNTPFLLTGLSPNDVLLAGAVQMLDDSGRWEGALVGTQAGTRILLVTVGRARVQTSVVVAPGALSADASRLEVQPGVGVADGNTPLPLLALVRDKYGNPLPRQSVSLSSVRNDVLIAPVVGFTGETGAFAAIATATDVGPAMLLAQVANAQLYATTLFVAGPPSPATSSVSVVGPAQAVADGHSVVKFMLVARDALAHPVIGASAVVTSASAADIHVVYDGVATSADGQLTFGVSSPMQGVLPISVGIAPLTLTATAEFVAP